MKRFSLILILTAALAVSCQRADVCADCPDNWIDTTKQQIQMLDSLGRHEEIAPLAQEVLDRLDREIQENDAAKAELQLKESTIIGFMVLFVLACMAIGHYASTRKEIETKNEALVRLMKKLTREAESEVAEPVAEAAGITAADQELFRQIDRAIREERLYADSSLQRQDILDRFNLRRQTLNDLLNECTEEKTFPAYINGIRMEEAARILRADLSQPFTAIAESVGLNPANFRIQFKQYYGMTPTEFRESL